jgi:hypothetical protein
MTKCSAARPPVPLLDRLVCLSDQLDIAPSALPVIPSIGKQKVPRMPRNGIHCCLAVNLANLCASFSFGLRACWSNNKQLVSLEATYDVDERVFRSHRKVLSVMAETDCAHWPPALNCEAKTERSQVESAYSRRPNVRWHTSSLVSHKLTKASALPVATYLDRRACQFQSVKAIAVTGYDRPAGGIEVDAVTICGVRLNLSSGRGRFRERFRVQRSVATCRTDSLERDIAVRLEFHHFNGSIACTLPSCNEKMGPSLVPGKLIDLPRGGPWVRRCY